MDQFQSFFSLDAWYQDFISLALLLSTCFESMIREISYYNPKHKRVFVGLHCSTRGTVTTVQKTLDLLPLANLALHASRFRIIIRRRERIYTRNEFLRIFATDDIGGCSILASRHPRRLSVCQLFDTPPSYSTLRYHNRNFNFGRSRTVGRRGVRGYRGFDCLLTGYAY